MSAGSRGIADRRWVWLTSIAGLAVIIAIVWVSLASGSDEPGEAAGPTTTTAAVSTTLQPPESSSTATETVAETPPTTVESVPFPTDPIPEGTAEETCAAVVAKLVTYKVNAEEGGLAVLSQLSLGLEEFEHEIDFLGQGEPWAVTILEQLYQVRRDWVTAYSAAQSGDQETARSRQESALEYLETAVGVDCST